MNDVLAYAVPVALLVFAWGYILGSAFPVNDKHEER